MIEIEKIEGCGDEAIREYLLCNPNTLIYSEPRFIKLVAEHLDASAFWLLARKEGYLVGALPFLVKQGLLGPVYNSLAYYGSNGSVIQAKPNESVKEKLIQSFYQEAGASGAVSATIITNPLECDADFFENHTKCFLRDERIGQITHFPALTSPDDLMTCFQNPRPRNIRRALKEGVVVQAGHEEALGFLYDTHVANMSAIGGLPKKREFFDSISGNLEPGHWKVYTATLRGQPIAALLLFYFNNTVEYFTPVIVEEYRNTQALALVIYTAMKDAIKVGFKNWNWGGTWLSQGGVYDFKKRWGTSEYRYYYYTKLYVPEVTNCSPAYLQEQYPGFFVFPYKYLKEGQ